MSKMESTSGKTVTLNKNISRSRKAGLQFPVGRIGRLLRKGRYSKRIAEATYVYLSAVLEYLAAELVELAGSAAHNSKRKRTTPRHLQLVNGNDEEFSNLLYKIVIPEGGVIPRIHRVLIPKGKKVTAPSSNV